MEDQSLRTVAVGVEAIKYKGWMAVWLSHKITSHPPRCNTNGEGARSRRGPLRFSLWVAGRLRSIGRVELTEMLGQLFCHTCRINDAFSLNEIN
jgi:hypothetical protein